MECIQTKNQIPGWLSAPRVYLPGGGQPIWMFHVSRALIIIQPLTYTTLCGLSFCIDYFYTEPPSSILHHLTWAQICFAILSNDQSSSHQIVLASDNHPPPLEKNNLYWWLEYDGLLHYTNLSDGCRQVWKASSYSFLLAFHLKR